MRVYRVYNRTENAPAAGLCFLKSQDAEKYKELIRWPYADSGFWPLPREKAIPMTMLDLQVENLDLPVLVEKGLRLVLMERENGTGAAPLLTGDCFDPEQWLAFTPEELTHPVLGPLLEQAQRKLWGLT